MTPFEKLASELKRLETGYREESLYRPLSDFLEEYANDRVFLHMEGVKVTNNPSSESVGDGVGFPDMEIKQNNRLIGYIEVKPPTQNLDHPSFSRQFNRYKESLENIIFTNFKKWTLYAWDRDGKSEKIAEATWDYETDVTAEELKKLLTVFFEGESYQAKTPHQLAIALARKTKLLSQQVEDALTAETPEKRLIDLKETFEQTLIQDIGSHQFANIYAETIAYSLFLAKLEHFEKGSNEDFTIRNAVDYLPKNIPVFKDLYQLTGGTVEPITPEIHYATEILIEQLNLSDVEKIHKKLIDHKPGEDPVIQFYAPFLSEYDPEEKKARGVYYTPKPVVDYIVRSVDEILKTKFNKPNGLGDESVQILDPATGTGTFLQSVIQNIYADIEKKNEPLGEQAVQREFNQVVSNHILKHIYGFELLVAPYAVAHLKLTLEMERLGFNFSMTAGDQDKDNDRLKIYLANTLDDPNGPKDSKGGYTDAHFFTSITDESEQARLVKKDEPILAIIGNPPYAVSSSNKSDWIEDLMQSYKKAVRGEQNLQPMSDDYIKFIRFGQWKIEQTGHGVFAMITNHSYLGGLIHRGMREELMKTYDQIYILDLHGNTTIGEKNPNGGIDQNVFDIKQGVAISFFLKYDDCKERGVWYSEVWGNRQEKFDFHLTNSFSSTKWIKLDPHATQNHFFKPQNLLYEEEYSGLQPFNKVMPLTSVGIVTSRDEFLISFEEYLLKQHKEDILSEKITDEAFQHKYNLNTKYFDVVKARVASKKDQSGPIIKCLYRPFDYRYVLYDRNFIERDRHEILQHVVNQQNLSMVLTRQRTIPNFNHVQVSNAIIELKSNNHDRNSNIFPLYLSATGAPQLSLIGGLLGLNRRHNLSTDVIDKFSEKLGLRFVNNGRGDLKQTFGPEDVFYYIYAVLHSPTYRTRYTVQLKIDFPRVPLTSDKELFKKLVDKGNELVNLHLLGENPFDKSKTIFDNTSKWNLKIGGQKPDDLENWKIIDVRYDEKTKRVYVNSGQYFEGIEKEIWDYMIGGYQVMDKWLKDRKKAGRVLSPDDTTHYMKIVVSLRETIRIMKEIDQAIPEWPIQ